eukprot:TRINITY_DN1515_c0_g1_i5.p2 TRINITY_DN1515_c0_g1~~TRINITY_DN1515_c0_g1_i5.p2  ORF type:complete len:105 (-),score=50.79 TRINITY_DN1515_c0_g1_i5:77-349(-)
MAAVPVTPVFAPDPAFKAIAKQQPASSGMDVNAILNAPAARSFQVDQSQLRALSQTQHSSSSIPGLDFNTSQRATFQPNTNLLGPKKGLR